MSTPTKPWLDAPPCPICAATCGTRDGEAIPAGHLRCAACGDDWPATVAELSKALASDAAWEAEQHRRMTRPDPEVARQAKVDEVAAEHARRQVPLFGAGS